MVYKWKSGARIKADANAAGAQFERLEQEGRLNAESVVEINKPEDAVLHGEFEWRNNIAADEWRKHQARHLMNSICIVTPANPETKEETVVRAFFTVQENNYESISAIFKSGSKTETLLNQALKELIAICKKYRCLKELAPVRSAIDEAMKGNAIEIK